MDALMVLCFFISFISFVCAVSGNMRTTKNYITGHTTDCRNDTIYLLCDRYPAFHKFLWWCSLVSLVLCFVFGFIMNIQQ